MTLRKRSINIFPSNSTKDIAGMGMQSRSAVSEKAEDILLKEIKSKKPPLMREAGLKQCEMAKK